MRILGRISCLLIFFCAPLVADAQGLWWFEDRPYFNPLRAGVRDANMSATIGFADRVAYLVEPKEFRPTWDIDVGAEMPIIGWQSESQALGRIPEGATGFGLWFPIDFHMLGDLFTDDSSPIINNDYRFGLMVKVQHGLTPHSSAGVRLHVGHESTHLGDEFSIVGQRVYPDTFERINVSWEFVDLVVQYERAGASTIAYRFGVTTTMPFRDSYYSIGPGSITESPVGEVTPSKNWYDLHGGLEYERQGMFGGLWSLYGSTELRWRSIYDYHRSNPDDKEDRQLSTNIIIGIRKSGASELGKFSPFLRLYHGVNTHGQFRNQPDFTLVGLGIRLTH